MYPKLIWIERQTPTLKAAGSSPVGRTKSAEISMISALFLYVYVPFCGFELRFVYWKKPDFISKIFC